MADRGHGNPPTDLGSITLRWLNEGDADSRILELVPERLGKTVRNFVAL
jgi:hypothetical protein